MEIATYREKINVLDEKIVSLLEERLETVYKIGEVKKELGLPVLDSGREQERLSTVRDMTKNELYKKHIENIYISIMDEAKKLEE